MIILVFTPQSSTKQRKTNKNTNLLIDKKTPIPFALNNVVKFIPIVVISFINFFPKKQ